MFCSHEYSLTRTQTAVEIRLTELIIVVRDSGDSYPDNRMYEEEQILCIYSTYLRTYIMLCV